MKNFPIYVLIFMGLLFLYAYQADAQRPARERSTRRKSFSANDLKTNDTAPDFELERLNSVLKRKDVKETKKETVR
ncbi:hypothetical protein ACFLS1_10670, partial [Verrucomicrobiota bacterium]